MLKLLLQRFCKPLYQVNLTEMLHIPRRLQQLMCSGYHQQDIQPYMHATVRITCSLVSETMYAVVLYCKGYL